MCMVLDSPLTMSDHLHALTVPALCNQFHVIYLQPASEIVALYFSLFLIICLGVDFLDWSYCSCRLDLQLQI